MVTKAVTMMFGWGRTGTGFPYDTLTLHWCHCHPAWVSSSAWSQSSWSTPQSSASYLHCPKLRDKVSSDKLWSISQSQRLSNETEKKTTSNLLSSIFSDYIITFILISSKAQRLQMVHSVWDVLIRFKLWYKSLQKSVLHRNWALGNTLFDLGIINVLIIFTFLKTLKPQIAWDWNKTRPSIQPPIS